MVAIQGNHVDVVRALLALGANVITSTTDGVITPLTLAVNANNAELIEMLALRGVDLDALNGNGEPAVCIAARHGRIDAIKALASLGADIDCAAVDGSTALSSAVAQGNMNLVNVLAELGVDLPPELLLALADKPLSKLGSIARGEDVSEGVLC
jgi:ankyrin repeat protein